MNTSSWISPLKRLLKSSKPGKSVECSNSWSLYGTGYQVPPTDPKAARLMELIGQAIDTWAAEYHLENLPKYIVFQQAYDAMKAIELLSGNSQK